MPRIVRILGVKTPAKVPSVPLLISEFCSLLLDCRVRVNLSLMVSLHSYDEEKSVSILFAVAES